MAHFLEANGFDARRGQQFKGTTDSPDIVCDNLSFLHIECKRVEAGNLYTWYEQAAKDAGDKKLPVVMHRRSDKPWMAVLSLEHFLMMMHNSIWRGTPFYTSGDDVSDSFSEAEAARVKIVLENLHKMK